MRKCSTQYCLTIRFPDTAVAGSEKSDFFKSDINSETKRKYEPQLPFHSNKGKCALQLVNTFEEVRLSCCNQ